MDPTALAKNITSRRLTVDGPLFTVKETLSEVLFLKQYGIVPTIDSLTPAMQIVVDDGEGRPVQLVPVRKKLGYSIGTEEIVGTILVWTEICAQKIEGGWLSVSEVSEAPVESGRYHISPETLRSFPSVGFTFRTDCSGVPCTNAAVWDYVRDGWDCFTCGRLRRDSRSADNWADLEVISEG